MAVLVFGVLAIWIVTFGAMAIIPLITERDGRKRGVPLPVTLSRARCDVAADPEHRRKLAA